MKKELVALSLLLLILAGNLWNQRTLDRLTSALDSRVEAAYVSAQAGDRARAKEAAERAEKQWIDAGLYTQIFIRHTDIDALTAAFCDYRAALAAGDEADVLNAYLSLRTGLRSLREMEKLSFGSIF